MTTTNTPSTATKNELLRELVIAIGCVAILLSGVGALYWIQTRPDEAAAGATVTTTAKAGDVKPTERPKPKAGVPTPDVAVTHADIYFDFKSARLRADAAKLLQDTAAAMTRNETWAVLITGYADIHGPAAYNKVLAQRRAESVKQFLVELGVPETSVKVAALGPEASLCDDPGTECQQLNRRVHLEIRRLSLVGSAMPATVVSPLTPKTEDLGQP
ncbi:MAG TPA: OmpA family protein [Methylomirabilota bacterium]|jgi:outer membrane protein OmpA-like peptidoglycan-associated protein